MAGRSRLAAAAAMAMLALPGLTSESQAERVHGRSQELGIAFTTSDSEWCGPIVSILLTADRVDVFDLYTIKLQQMIGRIRAVILDQCPLAERLQFEGQVKAKRAVVFETTRVTSWARLIQLTDDGAPELCTAAAPCEGRRLAYAHALQLLSGTEFADWVIDIRRSSTADGVLWRSKLASGKLSVVGNSILSTHGTDAGQLADALLKEIGERCLADTGKLETYWGESYGDAIHVRGLSCRREGKAQEEHAVAVMATASGYSLASALAIGAPAKTAAGDVRLLAQSASRR